MTVPSNARTSAGTRLYVCATAPGTYDAAGFGALTWIEVGEITDLGEFGKEFEKIEHKPLATRNIVKRKGMADNGAITLQLALDESDAGQDACYDGRDSDDSYSFKISMDGAAQLRYFSAQIMSFKESIGSGSSITGASIALEIDNEIVRA